MNFEYRELGELIASLNLTNYTIYKEYLGELSGFYEIVPLIDLYHEKAYSETDAVVNLLKLSKVCYEKGEDVLQKLSTIYNAALSDNVQMIILIDSLNNKPVDFYIGFSSLTATLGQNVNLLKSGIDGNFTGTKLDSVDKVGNLFEDIMGSVNAIASVSTSSSLRDTSNTENKDFIQGIDKFIDAMQGKIYTALFIAEPMNKNTTIEMKEGLETLYTTLSQFQKTTSSYNENESSAMMESFSQGISLAIAKSSGSSESITNTETEGISSSEGKSFGYGGNIGLNASGGRSNSLSNSNSNTAADTKSELIRSGTSLAGGILGGLLGQGPGAQIGGSIGGVAGRNIAPGLSNSITNSISNGISSSLGGGLGGNLSLTSNSSLGRNESVSVGETRSVSTQETNTEGATNTNTSGTTDTLSKGTTTQFESENKSVTSILKHIDSQLEKIENGRAYGLFKFGAYFMSSREDNAILAANIYKSLMIGDEVEVENRAVNIWREPEKLKHIKDYLKKGLNPMFSLEEVHNLYYDATTIVNGKDLPIHMGIPVKSVIGIPVVEHTRFGRSVPSIENDKLKLGSVFHMGKTENSYEVNLDIKNLTSHTFITGTTGSGKSNTIYKMLDELTKMGKKFLIIEPAKGEYKNVFGHHDREDVEVYGTNHKKTKLLRINPFKFNDDIHVLEHIDRLIDIFNVCWAMYAAMPAILKDAVERAYVVAGWDLELSENIHGENLYPTFEDVLEEIENVLNESQYSSDNKGDYIGALSTRIRSLTTGINGMIFTQNDLSDHELFNKNVIVDLSRVGSSETKSLIMGLLIMKLSEYYMENGEQNSDLKHVTVLEEAHNILKRTSTEQVSESSNLIGKSVEMLSNAIAEMRTYGEGFIIADQSPNMLDMSAIRNTNTKIIMKLPDISDRELVGKSANLNDDQIIELSRLETGVCAVYQNNWLEPVLCKVDEFKVPKDENGSVTKYVNSDDISKKLDMKTELINMVKAKQIEEGMDIPENFMQSDLKSGIKKTFLKVQNGTADKSELIYKLFYDKKTFNNISQKLDGETCLKNISQLTVPSIANYDVDIQKEIVQQLLIEQSKQNSNYLEILDRIKSIM